MEITYGSTIRLQAVAFKYLYISILFFSLHSHLINYPSGSGYQSVTGIPSDNDYNSLWMIKEAFGDNAKTYRNMTLTQNKK